MKLVAGTGEQIVVVPVIAVPIDVHVTLAVVPLVEDRVAEMYTVSSTPPLLEIFIYSQS
jgi:hypothetical protein